MKKEDIYGVYAPSWDITFIMIDRYDKHGEIVSSECVGWYHGEPSEEDNKTFKGKLKAKYNWRS